MASCADDADPDEPEPETETEEQAALDEETEEAEAEADAEDPFSDDARDDEEEYEEEEPFEAEEEPGDEFADETEPDGPAEISYDEDGRFTIQLFSWETKEYAEHRLNEWRDKGYDDAFLTESAQEDTTVFRLRLGRFLSLEKAEQIRDELNDSYEVNAWVDNYDRD